MILRESKIKSYSKILNEKHGEHGTVKRKIFHQKAISFYHEQVNGKIKKTY